MVEKNSKNVVVILYWANWCHFCTEFKPIWEELKDEIKNSDFGKLVTFEDYEETKKQRLMQEKGINGFPTIHINDEPYTGQRTLLNLMNAIKEKLNIKTQSGGEPGDYEEDSFFYKYLKYKTKYYNLLNKMNKLK
jgi:thiol-disulfide isomerase/thioredoxin